MCRSVPSAQRLSSLAVLCLLFLEGEVSKDALILATPTYDGVRCLRRRGDLLRRVGPPPPAYNLLARASPANLFREAVAMCGLAHHSSNLDGWQWW